MNADPILQVLAFSSLAAATAALGALPFAFGGRPAQDWVGAAYALAGGLMLGAGYLLMIEGLESSGLAAITGAALGVLYTYWAQRYAGTQNLDTRPLDRRRRSRADGDRQILQGALHAASEGVAIGVAMVLHFPLGIFLALALALHNVGEGMALTELLSNRGVAIRRCAGLAVATNVSQVLLAVAAFAVASALGPRALAAGLGFAASSLLYLVLTDLAPGAYQRAPKGIIAFLMTSSAGAVVLLADVLL